jgi:hypothetical protein
MSSPASVGRALLEGVARRVGDELAGMLLDHPAVRARLKLIAEQLRAGLAESEKRQERCTKRPPPENTSPSESEREDDV